MIKILAPSRSLSITRMQISAGADEIYLGVDAGDYNIYSFGGRFKSMNGIKTQLSNYDELQHNIDYCKRKNVTLQLTANMHYIPPAMEDEYLEHIRECARRGVDQLIISNLGLIKKVRSAGIDTPIVAGSFTFIPNSECIKMLSDMGVCRVVLPHAIKTSEIEMIKNVLPNMELEIFALIGGGNNCGRCMMFHSPVRRDIGPGCRAEYSVNYDGQCHDGVTILDAAADCSLCSMKDLIDAGVDSLKIVGREASNEVVVSKFTEIFYAFRKGVYEGKKTDEIKAELEQNDIVWSLVWKPRFCEQRRCKFHKTAITSSYI